MYAQRIYVIKYTVPGDPALREQARGWFDPVAYKNRFEKVNPKATVEGVYDQATGQKVV